METYTTIILTGVAAITLAAVGLALDVYLKYKFSKDSLTYSLAHIGIIWGILVGTLLIGGTFTAAVAAWLGEHKFLTVMICGSVYAASLAESYRQRSYKLTIISSLLFVGVTRYVVVSTGLTVLLCITTIIALFIACGYIDSAISKARKAVTPDDAVSHAHTTHDDNPPPSGHRIIWQRASAQEETLAQDDTQPAEVSFQQMGRGLNDSVPRPYEPTFHPFTETVTKI